MCYMFYGCNSLKKLKLLNFDTQNVINISKMFHGRNSLTKIDLSNFQTQKVKNMNILFCNCKILKELNFHPKNAAGNLNLIFHGCFYLKKGD